MARNWRKVCGSIKGLLPKSRLYVYLSKDNNITTKRGSRHWKPILYVVKAGELYRDGYKFYISRNDVLAYHRGASKIFGKIIKVVMSVWHRGQYVYVMENI